MVFVILKTGLKYKRDIPLGKQKYLHYRISPHTRQIEKSVQFCLTAGKFSIGTSGHRDLFLFEK